jgi:GDP-L-fucose synthase
MTPDASIFVAGHRGLVGSAIVRRLQTAGFARVIVRERQDLDLREQVAVSRFFESARPQFVFLAAARVGGILANQSYPAEFLRDNLAIQTNVIEAAYRSGTEKLLFLGSSCIYPKHAAQPIAEESLLTGALEPTNEWYAIAKIAGLKLCQAYQRQYGFRAISAMPTNVYGPGDNFSLKDSHVLPALIRKFHEAKEEGRGEVEIWGTGTPRREFLHVDDVADACVFLMQRYESECWINVGSGQDLSISELAARVAKTVGYRGEVRFNPEMPDGTPRKLLDNTKLTALGWTPRVGLDEGIERTYRWFIQHRNKLRD